MCVVFSFRRGMPALAFDFLLFVNVSEFGFPFSLLILFSSSRFCFAI